MLPCEIARERFYQWLDTQYKRGDEMLAERQMALKYGVNRGAKNTRSKGVYIKSTWTSKDSHQVTF